MNRDERQEAKVVRPVALEELKRPPEAAQPLSPPSLELVHDVRVRLTVSVGRAQISIGELFSLKEGGQVKLDRLTSDPVDVLLDDKLVARGELVVADDHFAVRITDVAVRP